MPEEENKNQGNEQKTETEKTQPQVPDKSVQPPKFDTNKFTQTKKPKIA